MKAKGYSGSRRFSARLKWTRPTERRRLSRLFRKSARETLSSESSIANASPISRQNRPRTSGRRYSPPVIGGASSMSAPSSLMAGGASSPASAGSNASPFAQSSATQREAKSRHHASAGGKALPASPAPSCSSPCPAPLSKRPRTRSASARSRTKSSSPGSRRSAPCGVRTGMRERDMGCLRTEGARLARNFAFAEA